MSLSEKSASRKFLENYKEEKAGMGEDTWLNFKVAEDSTFEIHPQISGFIVPPWPSWSVEGQKSKNT